MIIAFCVPGRTQSVEFTTGWTETVIYCLNNQIKFYLYTMTGSDIYHVRNDLVSLEAKIPWDMMPCFGGAPYDYMMWIDGDIGFKPYDVMKLINSGKDIISGVCPMGPTRRCPCGDLGYDENGQPTLGYIDIAALDKLENEDLIEIEYAGFGFIAVKKGVFESMDFPWFRSTPWKHAGHDINPSEDIGWCFRAREKGWKIWLHPGVRCTHNKELCLRA